MCTIIPDDRRRKNAFHLCHSIELRHAPEVVFRFLTAELPRHYARIARGHEVFSVRGGGDVAPGAVIDCRERAGNQEVHHTYVVTGFRTNEHLAYASTPTRSFIHLKNRVIAGESETFLYQDLAALPDGGTRLTTTIVIALGGFGTKLLAWVTQSRGLWLGHLREELGGLSRALEAHEGVDGLVAA